MMDGTREAVGAAEITLGPTSAAAPTASRKTPMRIVGAGVPDLVLASGCARTSASPTTLGDHAVERSGGVGASDFALLTGFAEAPTPMPKGGRNMERARSAGGRLNGCGRGGECSGDEGTRSTIRVPRAPSPLTVTEDTSRVTTSLRAPYTSCIVTPLWQLADMSRAPHAT